MKKDRDRDRKIPGPLMSRSFQISVFSISVFLLVFCVYASAQQPGRIWRVGLLTLSALPDHEALLEGLRDLGYVEGRNLSIERRNAEGHRERLPDLAADLVRTKVDAIVAQSNFGASAAAKATAIIPIVFVTLGDPVEEGLVASLARPGGNLTGFSLAAPELSGKRLEIFREVVPTLKRVVVLMNPANPRLRAGLKEMEIGARSLGVRLRVVEVRDVTDLDKAFAAIKSEPVDGLIVEGDPILLGQRVRIFDFVNQHRLPAIYGDSPATWTGAGGLIAYGASLPQMYRRAAAYVDKVLRGTKPGDLPVERPAKFELVINLKAAKQISLTIPPNVLARADKVIK
jgi:ABC-type uncharacterized transport system substrate-binding protein